MNKKIIFSVMLVGLLVFAAVMAYSQNNSTSTVRWEYKLILSVKNSLIEEEANKLGAQGWELVAVNGNGPSMYFKWRLP